MTQYFFVDESGDPGLDDGAGSSSHFVVAMVQLPNRALLDPFKHIVGANSRNEDGLQLADMIAGAIRLDVC